MLSRRDLIVYATPCSPSHPDDGTVSDGLNDFNFLNNWYIVLHLTRSSFFSESPTFRPILEEGLYYIASTNDIIPACTACHVQTHMQHCTGEGGGVLIIHTFSAHKRLIFTAKPPALCAACTYVYNTYSAICIRSGELDVNLHFIELKRRRWSSCYYDNIVMLLPIGSESRIHTL